ncbi:MAG: hypothetical protein MUC92_08725 [Fimbriimonadaceae bacterium]|jgi:translin|nr:hypothetical protein [Fimbriimonadaceae bacterium]
MNWDSIVTHLKSELDGRHGAREEGLRFSRQLIQTSSKAIKHIHRHQFDEASRLLEEAKTISKTARLAMAPHPEILYAGYLQDAEKEMVEAECLFCLVQSMPLPSPEDGSISPTSYLNGIGEAASELRRFVLDLMRKGDLERSDALLGAMESIYDDLTTFDYPDGVTGGLRRTCDALRAVIERTRSDLTMTKVQNDLLQELRRQSPKLSSDELPKTLPQ